MREIKSTTHNAIKDFFLDFRAYISEVFSSDPDEATLDWTPSEPVSITSARTAPFNSAYGNALKAISEFPT